MKTNNKKQDLYNNIMTEISQYLTKRFSSLTEEDEVPDMPVRSEKNKYGFTPEEEDELNLYSIHLHNISAEEFDSKAFKNGIMSDSLSDILEKYDDDLVDNFMALTVYDDDALIDSPKIQYMMQRTAALKHVDQISIIDYVKELYSWCKSQSVINESRNVRIGKKRLFEMSDGLLDRATIAAMDRGQYDRAKRFNDYKNSAERKIRGEKKYPVVTYTLTDINDLALEGIEGSYMLQDEQSPLFVNVEDMRYTLSNASAVIVKDISFEELWEILDEYCGNLSVRNLEFSVDHR